MNIEELNKTSHSLTNLFRGAKEDDSRWVQLSSSRSWSPEDNKDMEERAPLGPRAQKHASCHSRSIFSKVARSKSLEDALKPMSTLSQALSKLPVRSYTFRGKGISSQSVVQDTVEEDVDSLEPTYKEVLAEDAQIEYVPTTLHRQEGTLIRRRRSRQRSKGRRGTRKVCSRTLSSGGEGNWEKFIMSAAAASHASELE